MEMEMVDALPSLSSRIRDDAEAPVRDAVALRELSRNFEQSPEKRAILGGELSRGRDVTARDEQDVRRCTRRDVAERDEFVVTMNDVGWNVSGCDAAEQAVRVGHGVSYHRLGFEVIRNPISPTAPAIT
jgi:hypothetical protein